MKILAFTDTHANRKSIKLLFNKVQDVDFMVCAGDISDWGRGIEPQLKSFERFRKPLIIIHGNHESRETMQAVCKHFDFCRFIHKASYEINDYVFLGYGGGGFSKTDSEFERLASLFKQHYDGKKKIILITHAPPYGTKVDLIPGIGHRGSNSIRKFIEEVQPLLHICGHLHETFSETDTIGQTIIVNPGPEGKIIEV